MRYHTATLAIHIQRFFVQSYYPIIDSSNHLNKSMSPHESQGNNLPEVT